MVEPVLLENGRIYARSFEPQYAISELGCFEVIPSNDRKPTRMLSIQDSDQAKLHAVRATSRYRTYDESVEALRSFREFYENATDDEGREIWQKQIVALESWLGSEKFKTGEYPQGIDDLILELIEWRAAQYALQNVETERKPFVEIVFYQQWLVGGAYSVFSLLGKLTGKDPRENSLRNLWMQVAPFIQSDGACQQEELEFIARELHSKSGHFTHERSRAMLFRNTVIAHNEKSVTVDWKEIDQDIRILIRMWSLIVSWSSLGILNPFRSSEQAFAGLDVVFSGDELSRLKKERQEYIDRAVLWCQTRLHNGSHDVGRTAFSTVHVTTTIYPAE